MEEQGLLERSLGIGDRRTRMVRLTEIGQQTMNAATPFAQENARIMSEQLTREEKSELLRLLGKLRSDDDPRLNTL